MTTTSSPTAASTVLYLSWLPLNTRHPEVVQDLHDVQQMHQRTLTGFGDILGLGLGREAHGVLWRTDTNAAGTVLIVQSATTPDWTRLPVDYCTAAPRVRDISALRRALRPGHTLRYRIAANATHTKRPKNGTRIPLRHRDEQLHWLHTAARTNGFRLTSTPDIHIPAPLTGTRLKGKTKVSLTIQPVRYDGTLAITDPGQFWHALTTGLGPAKAYGCGMLSLGNAATAE